MPSEFGLNGLIIKRGPTTYCLGRGDDNTTIGATNLTNTPKVVVGI